MEQFYTVREVAERLSMTEDSIREKLRKGEFNGTQPALKNGRDYRIPESGIHAYISSNAVIPPKSVSLRGFWNKKALPNNTKACEKLKYEDLWPKEGKKQCAN